MCSSDLRSSDVRHLISNLADGVYTGYGEEPTEEELKKIEESEKEYRKQKEKFKKNKTFGAVKFGNGEYQNRAQEKKAKGKRKKTK